MLHYRIMNSWACVACLFLLACCHHWEIRDDSDTHKSLEEVVDAAQNAIDISAKVTAKEIKHWKAVCERSRESAQASYREMLASADAICQSRCKGGKS